MLTLGVLCSGGLGFDTLSKIQKKHEVHFVLTDSHSNTIIEFAKSKGIPCFAGNPRGKKGFEFIKDFDVDVIASINYLFIIEQDIIDASKKLTFNIHGSLLPKYRGRTPHVWAIINGENKAGITAHVIDSGCDTGKVITQIEVPIELEDTGAMMLDKYAKAYFPLVNAVLDKLASGTLDLKKQDESEATYFVKRSPDDGEIVWDWESEQVRNWVRAQADPYPGAFSYYGGEKVVIDKLTVEDTLSDDEFSPGEIINIEPKIVVKTGNGAVSLDVIRTKNYNFISGKQFDHENRR